MNSILWVSGLFVFAQLLFLIEFYKLKDTFFLQNTNISRAEFYFILVVYFFSLIGILVHSSWVFPLIFALNYLYFLLKWKGNFNGGSDNMSFVLLTGLFLAKVTENESTGLIYISLLVTSSYVMAGWAKAKNREWWTGESLIGFLQMSPLQPWVWQKSFLNPQGALILSRATLFFELSFPLALLHSKLTFIYIMAGVVFHFFNFIFFGLNRFFWIWISSYPALIWFTSKS
jgi:hypothetical protein